MPSIIKFGITQPKENEITKPFQLGGMGSTDNSSFGAPKSDNSYISANSALYAQNVASALGLNTTGSASQSGVSINITSPEMNQSSNNSSIWLNNGSNTGSGYDPTNLYNLINQQIQNNQSQLDMFNQYLQSLGQVPTGSEASGGGGGVTMPGSNGNTGLYTQAQIDAMKQQIEDELNKKLTANGLPPLSSSGGTSSNNSGSNSNGNTGTNTGNGTGTINIPGVGDIPDTINGVPITYDPSVQLDPETLINANSVRSKITSKDKSAFMNSSGQYNKSLLQAAWRNGLIQGFSWIGTDDNPSSVNIRW